MVLAYLSLGGNLGDPKSTLQRATDLISHWEGVSSARSSSFYCTSPVGGVSQPDFINSVLAIETTLLPEQLIALTQSLEQQFGIKKPIKNGPRFLDIDLLFYGELCLATPALTLPHPRWKERLFVLLPLLELQTEEAEKEKLRALIAPLQAKGDQSLRLLPVE